MSAAENRGIAKVLKEGVIKGKIALAKKYMTMGHTAQDAADFAEIDVELLK